jgi:hypothetical protein
MFVFLFLRQANFSYESHKKMDGDWGTLPKSGPYNLSGEWGGIMGSVVNRKYDFCLSAWSWLADREDENKKWFDLFFRARLVYTFVFAYKLRHNSVYDLLHTVVYNLIVF